MAFCTATSNLFGGVDNGGVLLFMTRELGFSGGKIGLSSRSAAWGAIGGALMAPGLARRFGVGLAIVLITIVFVSGIGPVLYIAGARAALAPCALTAGFGILGSADVAYNINQVSVRQALCPRRLQGRMNASVRFLVWGTLPIGGFLGGRRSAR